MMSQHSKRSGTIHEDPGSPKADEPPHENRGSPTAPDVEDQGRPKLEETESRQRTLTSAGQSYYEQTVNKFCTKLSRLRREIDCIVDGFQESNKDIETLVLYKHDLRTAYDRYRDVSHDFIDYLHRTGTEDSQREKTGHLVVVSTLDDKVNQVLQHIEQLLQMYKLSPVKPELSESKPVISNSVDTRSQKSKRSAKSLKSSSRKSVSSSGSEILMRQKVKAVAAKAKLKFIEKEAELKRELEVLGAHRDADIAEAEFKAMQDFVCDFGSEHSNSDVDPEEKLKNTEKYVEDVNNLRAENVLDHAADTDNIERSGGNVNENLEISSNAVRMVPQSRSIKCNLTCSYETFSDTASQPPLTTDDTHQSIPRHQVLSDVLPALPETRLNPDAPTFIPHMNEMANFIVKKDLMRSRLTSFEDSPQTYPAWKLTYLSVVQDLGVSPAQELDLLVRYLGPESREYAKSIRASNADNPVAGCKILWDRLDERYGAPERVEEALQRKLKDFPRLQGNPKRLYDLCDLLNEVASLKRSPKYEHLLSYFDTSVGVKPIVQKLSFSLQNKWSSKASKYKLKHNVLFPPFSVFCQFVKEAASMMNDPALMISQEPWHPKGKQDSFTQQRQRNSDVKMVKKTDVQDNGPTSDRSGTSMAMKCPVHKLPHSLNQCKAFRRKPLRIRRQILADHNLCYRCCESQTHVFKNCDAKIKCEDCGSDKHTTAMHHTPLPGNHRSEPDQFSPPENHRSEPNRVYWNTGLKQAHGGEEIVNKCTSLCGENFIGRSCAKIVLVKVFDKGNPEKCLSLYALLDDQSNCTLAKSEFFDLMEVPASTVQPFILTSCAGRLETSGRRATGFMVVSADGSESGELPMVTECNEIPDDRREIPTPDITSLYEHLREVPIPPLDPAADILLLIGRDMIHAHIVHDQRIGPRNTPFAQKLSLGWVIVGDVCLGKFHKPGALTVRKTSIIESGRNSVLAPCTNSFHVKEVFHSPIGDPGANVFMKSDDDDKIGMSIEDRQFLEIMRNSFEKDADGRWKAPLPFKSPRPRLSNNRTQALKRAYLLDASLKKNPIKREHMVTFMKGLMDSGAMEEAPLLSRDTECWYLPLFGIYHPRKPEKIRGVFDSSVLYEGVSLNQLLLSGPNLTNDLTGVLLRFRKDKVAFVADIEQMFYRFLVREDCRNFLRFFWYRNNNPDDVLMEYRMRVHVFVNTPSPAVATYGLRRTVENADDIVKDYVCKNFYVDDGLASVPTSEEAIDLLKKTQTVLMNEAKIRLHKIASNSVEVMEAFPSSDLEKNLRSVQVCSEELPMQQSLGLVWDLNSDTLTFNTPTLDRPYTKRGILSMVNSLFDPLGVITPVVIHGRILLREIAEDAADWDEPLPANFEAEWLKWKQSLLDLNYVYLQRMFTPTSFTEAVSREIHIYADASEKAICAVAYLRTVNTTGDINVGFVMGKSRVAPVSGHTIPRLELCGAVLATELGAIVCEHLELLPAGVRYYTDSRVVLGYLNNRSRRFYNYVSNRVSAILRRSRSEQWCFVPTEFNPADIGTRCVMTPQKLMDSDWLCGPSQLMTLSPDVHEEYPLVDAQTDKELRPEVVSRKTVLRENLAARFQRFSSLQSLKRAISLLKRVCQLRCGTASSTNIQDVNMMLLSELFVVRTAQEMSFKEEIVLLKANKPLPCSSGIADLCPFIDKDGILRVGGRLKNAPLHQDQRNPAILHGKSHLAKLLVTHYHEIVQHQGRLITEGAIRSSGYWIVGAKRLVSSVLHHCVTCRKLRGRLEYQRMADLPKDRATPSPPFSTVGVDVFGPWSIVARKTRGGLAHSKRWAVLFSCMASRAVHIEVIEQMTSSSYINALRLFVSLRGPVKEFRSDRGTNFIGALDDLQAEAVFVEGGPVKDFLLKSKTRWVFNPPHASHMGGSWERVIGLARRILDAMLLDPKTKQLSHEVLCTFMCEVCAILNSRPVCPISSDPEDPVIISPSMLLTQKGFDDMLPSIDDAISIRDIYQAQWKHVQLLSNQFWKRWREGYLQNLQKRSKWQNTRPDVKEGDVVLLREKSVSRGQWPMGLVLRAFKSDSDDKVRTVEIRAMKEGHLVPYVRPVTEVVVLVD